MEKKMTPQELELKRLKKAFKRWSEEHADRSTWSDADVADLFWPLLEFILNDPIHSAEKTALLNRFKHALGMELFAHERFGLDNE